MTILDFNSPVIQNSMKKACSIYEKSSMYETFMYLTHFSYMEHICKSVKIAYMSISYEFHILFLTYSMALSKCVPTKF